MASGLGVVGLDMSLTGPAAAWLPKGWSGDPDVVKVETWPVEMPKIGTPDALMSRLETIANGVCRFVTEMQPTAVFIEDYAYSMHSSSVTRLAELGGIVRLHLWRRRPSWYPTAISASEARKVMFGKGSGKGIKEWVDTNMRRLKKSALYWTGDQVDAVVIANAGASRLEWPTISFPGV